ncbi:hypothetical protein GOBAR_AA06852 [Gossypium barbadense]|uniref:Wax synthase domain-containing protein n=1 Tax=Gossypium barbadense TaxID=3634 RepID=A0A2P5YDP7_GOSBA|nr:hypothetical protein GOBAR_AA06852 [Gossypium barbadense]
MENELHNFIKVWILAIISLCYCFYISSKLPKGIFKLISLTPIFIFFLYLPLTISTAPLVGITAFFLSCYKQNIHKNVVLVMFCVRIYIELELILAVAGTLARAMFGFEIEPQFNEPYLATSLQDFWGRRWNLIVTSILRPTVYYPIRRISTRLLGSRWASLPAIFGVFVVSVVVKKVVPDKMRLHSVVSGALALGFVAVTAVWLFLPQLVRNGVDEKSIGEYSKLMIL